MDPVHPALRRLLNRLLVRSSLSADEQEALLSIECKAHNVQPRHDIITPGEQTDHACLVAKGLSARFDQMLGGERQITAFHLPGDMCDLQSVVAPTAAWGIAAMTSSIVLFVPHAALREVAQRYPAIGFAFWRDTVADASILAKWIGIIGRQEARSRIAHLLCEFATRMESAGLSSRESFTLDATQEQIADATGLTSVHVNRTMQRLRADGAIATRGRVVDIPDWNLLADIAEFDPTYLMMHRPKMSDRESQLAVPPHSGVMEHEPA